MGPELLGDIRSGSKLGKFLTDSCCCKDSQLSSKSIDFVLAFPQADLEIPDYMESSIGFDAPEGEYQIRVFMN